MGRGLEYSDTVSYELVRIESKAISFCYVGSEKQNVTFAYVFNQAPMNGNKNYIKIVFNSLLLNPIMLRVIEDVR